jgi:hypothetical protein
LAELSALIVAPAAQKSVLEQGTYKEDKGEEKKKSNFRFR